MTIDDIQKQGDGFVLQANPNVAVQVRALAVARAFRVHLRTALHHLQLCWGTFNISALPVKLSSNQNPHVSTTATILHSAFICSAGACAQDVKVTWQCGQSR